MRSARALDDLVTERASEHGYGWSAKRRAVVDRWRSSRLRASIARLVFPYTRPGSLWDNAPRLNELGNLGEYRAGVTAWRRMRESGSTMMGCRRGRTLHRLAGEVERRGVAGSLVDCGVANGGSTAILASGAPSRLVWGFDSFEQTPEPDEDATGLRSGYAGRLYPPGSERRAMEAISRIADPAQIRLVNGWVDETYPEHKLDVGDVALLHIDLEAYEPVRLTLETFYSALSRGGYVVVNCYGNWPEVRRATDDFRRIAEVPHPLIRVDHTGVFWRKDDR
jgi:O-methyltransferase